MQQRIGFPVEISVIKSQAWQFDEKSAFLRFFFLKEQLSLVFPGHTHFLLQACC